MMSMNIMNINDVPQGLFQKLEPMILAIQGLFCSGRRTEYKVAHYEFHEAVTGSATF